MLLRHPIASARIFDCDSAGSSNAAARIAMIAMTTSNSISVNPRRPRILFLPLNHCFLNVASNASRSRGR